MHLGDLQQSFLDKKKNKTKQNKKQLSTKSMTGHYMLMSVLNDFGCMEPALVIEYRLI